MPATTGLVPRAAERPGLEAQLGAMPGYYLSGAVRSSAEGAAIRQAALVVEPGEWIGAPGLSAGARYVGDSDGYLEPMLRYRRSLDAERRYSGSAVVYATHASASEKQASYSATRGGAELALDARLTAESPWFELHWTGAIAATALSAEGEYCLDEAGRFGVDCPDTGASLTAAEANGVYPAATAGIALDFGRHARGVFHGGRAALHGTLGSMPRVESGEQVDARPYAAAGLSLTLGFGAAP